MKVISQLREHVLFPFLLPLFFVLHTSRYLFGGISLLGAIKVMLLYLLITAVIYIVARKCTRHGAGAGVATLLIMSLFIYWGELIRYINGALHTSNFIHLPFVLALWLLIAFILARLLNRQDQKTRNKVVFYLNTLFLVYIAVEAGLMGYAFIDQHGKPPMIPLTAANADKEIHPTNGPNVYLLLFDEYSSTSSLKDEWAFDNSATDSMLHQRGFLVNSNSKSNYQVTFFSMASMLNMDYLNPDFEHKRLTLQDYPECFNMINSARVVRLFRQAGYTFHNLSIFDIDDQPKPYLQDLVVRNEDMLTVNNFYHVAIESYIPYLKNRQAIKHDPSFHDPAFYNTDNYNNRRVAEVIKHSSNHESSPKFVYAHFLMPHAPYYYDSTGTYLPESIARTSLEHLDPKLYWYNLRHANGKMVQMIDSIQKNEKGNAVIIVMADHGLHNQPKTIHKDELFRNLNAVYLPNKDYSSIPDSITNVNMFRVLFNSILGTKYPLHANKSTKLNIRS